MIQDIVYACHGVMVYYGVVVDGPVVYAHPKCAVFFLREEYWVVVLTFGVSDPPLGQQLVELCAHLVKF